MTTPHIENCCFYLESSAKAESDATAHQIKEPCQKPAEWSIAAYGASSADVEYACTEHVGQVLGDATTYTVSPIWADA